MAIPQCKKKTNRVSIEEGVSGQNLEAGGKVTSNEIIIPEDGTYILRLQSYLINAGTGNIFIQLDVGSNLSAITTYMTTIARAAATHYETHFIRPYGKGTKLKASFTNNTGKTLTSNSGFNLEVIKVAP